MLKKILEKLFCKDCYRDGLEDGMNLMEGLYGEQIKLYTHHIYKGKKIKTKRAKRK